MKSLRPKQHLLIANIITFIGAGFAAVEILLSDVMTGFRNQNVPILLIVAIAFFVLGVAYRLIMVKCPHCGSALTGSKKIPANCPACGSDLSKLPHELEEEAEETEEAETENDA